jgi:flagellar basal-body rod modification protein FlgD
MGIDALGSLGKTDFLNLLATQLQYQDPMNPMSDTEFISQLAQFSALEAANNTSTAIGNLSAQQSQLQATAWLGKSVAGIDSSTQQVFTGVVQAVDFSGTSPTLLIGSQKYALKDVLRVQS